MESNFARRGGIVFGPLTAQKGAGTLREAIERYPGARVRVVAERRDPRDLESAAYLVLPALSCDAVPPAVFRAFAYGLPVIASRLAPLAEVIEPGRNGLLFEPGSARELARRLAWADAFSEKMRQMGECARADYQARFIGQWSYQTLFGERRRSARL
ncbi:MAG TPA: glycosyltransferase [Burkholderiales bacterium]